MWAYQDIRMCPQGPKNFRERNSKDITDVTVTATWRGGDFQAFSPQPHGGSLSEFKWNHWNIDEGMSWAFYFFFGLGSRHLLSRPARLPCTSSHPPSPRRILHPCGSWSRWCARWWRFWCRTSPRPDGFPRVGSRRPPRPPSSTWCSPLSSTEQGLEPTVSSQRWRDVSLRSEHSKTQS